MRDAAGFDGVKPSGEAPSLVRFAGLVLNLDACVLACESGETIPLTHGEFAVLRMFVARPGRVISRDALLDAFANRRFEPFDRSVDVLIGKLRRKIETDPKEPCLIVTVPGEGYRFDGLTRTFDRKSLAIIPESQDDERLAGRGTIAAGPERTEVAQTIKYCRAPDGVRIAYATSGSGPFLVKSGNWMNHLEYDWESPIWRHVFRGLSCGHTLIRYDARGNGMSDWDVDTLSLDAWVTDLEAVVDAVGIERFPLLGISQGGPVAVAYSVRCPERVSHLILYGAFALGGKKRAPAEKEMREAMATLMRLGWGADNASFRQMFTARFIPGGTHEQADIFNALQRKTTSPEGAARYFDVVGDFDITDLLPRVKAPTLVMHVRDDQLVPFEAGRRLAAGIPGARFIALPGRNHLFLEHEPASDRFFEEIRLFLKG
jgi:pimeloyl-ACP methyl ester carboxylesterase/DNA-binding winged helix-turn-helix (wHTH) protein